MKASDCRCSRDEDFGHRAMFPESPAFASWDISGGHRGLDPPPSAMGWEADHSVPNTGTSAQLLQVASEYVAGQIAIRRPAGEYRGNEAVRSRHSLIVSAH